MVAEYVCEHSIDYWCAKALIRDNDDSASVDPLHTFSAILSRLTNLKMIFLIGLFSPLKPHLLSRNISSKQLCCIFFISSQPFNVILIIKSSMVNAVAATAFLLTSNLHSC